MKWGVTLAALLLCPILGLAQGVPYNNQVIFSGGFPYPTVRVCTEPATGTPCTPLASIFSDAALTQPLPNPFTGDNTGKFVFYANPAVTYHAQISGVGLVPYDIANITLPGNGGGGGGGTGTVIGTPNQITVSTSGTPSVSQVSLPSPTLFPGAATFNGPVGVSNVSNGIYTFADPFCAFQGVSSAQDELLCDLQGIGPVFNTGDGSQTLAYQLNKIQQFGYQNGQVNTWHAANNDFEPAVSVSIADGNITSPLFTGSLAGNITVFPSPQVFPVNAVNSALVLGVTDTNPCCALAEGSVWMNDTGINGNPHIVYYDGNGYQSPLTNVDTPCSFSNGCTGTAGSFNVMANSPVLSGTPYIADAIGKSLTLQLNTGDQMDLQQGIVTPFIQATPQAGHIKTGYGTDNKFQGSYDGDPFKPFLRQGPTVCNAGGTGCSGTPGDFTTANNTALQNITGLSFSKTAVAATSNFRCVIMYSQAVANVAVAFGIQAVTNAPTNINATGLEQTGATAFTAGSLNALATTSATNIVSAVPTATATVFRVQLDGTIEDSAHANNFNLMVSTATGTDAVTVKRGSYCAF